MRLTFKNSVGTLYFGDGAEFKITAVSGLYVPSKTYGTVRYAEYDGQFTYQSNANARVITLGCDIVSKNLRSALERAMRVLNRAGTLTLDYGDKVRKIECSQVTVSVSDRSTTHAVFGVQFVCDDPYFTDEQPVKAGIHGSVNLITNPITLPCMLSSRDTKRIIENAGDKDVYPIVTIRVVKKGTTASATEYGYKLLNNTTGKSVHLQYTSKAGERIVIDFGKRTVTSIKGGTIITNIIGNIAQGSELADFYLIPGGNEIEAVDLGTDDESLISLEYENKYVEAVY